MSKSQTNHRHHVLSQIDRSYFPSVMLGVELDNPEAEGDDRDWAIFRAGVVNGADLSHNGMYPRLIRHDGTLAEAYVQVNKALDQSSHLEIDALESLLAARNVLARHLKEEWEIYYSSIKNWASGTMGLRVEYLLEDAKPNMDSLCGNLVALATQGRYHPFWAWAVSTYVRRKNMKLGELRKASAEFRTEPPYEEAEALQKIVTMPSAVTQYLQWARIEYKEMRQRVNIKAEGMTLPTEALTTWIATELLDEGDEDDE
jgi:hypothetical protein